MEFPLSDPDRRTRETLHKTWERHRLETYLKRWARTEQPKPPDTFWRFSTRACDLGCGLGKFLIDRSTNHPERAYLGIDKGTNRGGCMKKRFQQTGNPNLFGIHGNAIPILAALPDNSFDELTIFYPNPWWPTKHCKKRWSYHPLLPKLTTLLKPGARMLLTSNESFYLEEWCYALSRHPRSAPMTLEYAGPVRTETGRTHFETKFLESGIACGEICFFRG